MISNDTPDKWKMKREVSIPDILTLLSAAIAILFSFTTLSSRISLLEQSQSYLVADQTKQDADRAIIKQEINAKLNILDSKIDQLLIREGKK